MIKQLSDTSLASGNTHDKAARSANIQVFGSNKVSTNLRHHFSINSLARMGDTLQGKTVHLLVALPVLVLHAGLVDFDAKHGEAPVLCAQEPCVRRRVGEQEPESDSGEERDDPGDDHEPSLIPVQ